MATVLDKQLKRQITVDGENYTVALDPEGIKLIGKGKRTPQVELLWRDLLNGDAAMAVALNASVAHVRSPAIKQEMNRSSGAAKVRRSNKTTP